jgi:hypothetical protein
MNRYIALLVYSVWGLALYGVSLGFGFILDDEFQILNNPQVQDFGKIFLNFTNSTVASAQGMQGIYYKPVMMMIYNLLWHTGGGGALAFHLFQLIVHVLNSFLIFLLFQNFFHEEKKYGAFLAGALFLCHPVNSEAVVMIADLQEPLFTFFGLAALLVLARARFPLFAAGLFLLSLLSKESGLLYLLIAIPFAWMFHRERFKMSLASVGVAGGVYLGLRFGLAGLNVLHAGNMQINRADLATRLLSLPKILFHYMSVFFGQSPPSLTQDWVVSQMSFVDFWGPLAAVLVLLTLLVIYALKKPRREFHFFFLWLVVGMGLHSQLIPLDGTVSDRWFYFPLIGAIGMALLLFKAAPFAPKKLKLGFTAVLSVLLSVKTFARTELWREPLTLFQQDVKEQPESFYLNNNLGLELLKAGRFAEAIPYFEKTITVSPPGSREGLVAWRNLGAAYLELGNYPKAEECFKISLADPDVRSVRALAMLLSRTGRVAELKELLKQGLTRYPEDRVLRQLQRENP